MIIILFVNPDQHFFLNVELPPSLFTLRFGSSSTHNFNILRGLCRILPVLPAHYVHNSIDLISLKVNIQYTSGNSNILFAKKM